MGDSEIFASALSQCIREAAARGASAFARWGDGCIQPTFKVDVQAEVLGETVTAFEEKYGYQAALWCTFYSARMSGEEFRADNPQPNNPQFDDVSEGVAAGLSQSLTTYLLPKPHLSQSLTMCTAVPFLLPPRYDDWYGTILCPWDLNNCGAEELGLHGDERHGVPTAWAGDGQNFKYAGEPERRTMSCALCGFLDRTLGHPPVSCPATHCPRPAR